jgi:hypothetical protein
MVIGATKIAESAVVVHSADTLSPAPPIAAPRTRGDWHGEARRLFDDGKGLKVREVAKQLGRNYWTVYSLLKPKGGQRQSEPAIEARAAPARKIAQKTDPAPRPARARPVIVSPTPLPASSAPPPLAAEHDEGIPVEFAFPTDGPGLHILALRGHHCRWPMGPGTDRLQTYCGCDRSPFGGPYCEPHAIKAHQVGAWPPKAPLIRPTRMPKPIAALPDARNRT